MCGIAGIYDYGSTAGAVTDARIARMTAAIAHRGPDSDGLYTSPDGRLGLGFRRLAIIDLSAAGNQPMSNEDGSVRIVFNGEIYNHAVLRRELEEKGHVFRSQTDTESIVHLYEELGPACVRRLRGMFAFAIWDANRRRLLLARDRVGIKPLYYAFHGGALLFASEIKAILALPDLARDLDEEALAHYLTFMVAPAPRTLFADVGKLPPATTMVVDHAGKVTTERYWEPHPVPAQPGRTLEEYAKRTRAVLEESIEAHMMSDVPYGVFLSGGVDSSANVALMAEHSPRPVNTFSVGFAGHEEFNELHHARRVAEHFGANHHEVVIGHDDALQYLPELIHSQDEPIADWVCVPLYFVSRLARRSGVIVVQVGEGADELFAGYPAWLRELEIRRWIDPWMLRLPGGAVRLAAAAAERVGRRGSRLAGRTARALRLALNDEGRYWGQAIVFRGREKARLLAGAPPGVADHSSLDLIDEEYRRLEASAPTADRLQRMAYLELRQRLPELLLMRVDKITMSTSVEARVPFLDQNVVDLALSIPEHIKVQGWRTKAVLKKAVEGLVPADVLARPKQGFGAPVAAWFRGPLRGPLEETLLSSSIHRRGYFDRAFIRLMLDQHVRAARDWSVELWTLYNLFLWYDVWIEGRHA